MTNGNVGLALRKLHPWARDSLSRTRFPALRDRRLSPGLGLPARVSEVRNRDWDPGVGSSPPPTRDSEAQISDLGVQIRASEVKSKVSEARIWGPRVSGAQSKGSETRVRVSRLRGKVSGARIKFLGASNQPSPAMTNQGPQVSETPHLPLSPKATAAGSRAGGGESSPTAAASQQLHQGSSCQHPRGADPQDSERQLRGRSSRGAFPPASRGRGETPRAAAGEPPRGLGGVGVFPRDHSHSARSPAWGLLASTPPPCRQTRRWHRHSSNVDRQGGGMRDRGGGLGLGGVLEGSIFANYDSDPLTAHSLKRF